MTGHSLRVASILALLALTASLAAQVDTDRTQTAKTAGASASNPLDEFQSFSALLSGGMGDNHDRRIYRSGNLMRADFEDSYRITDLKSRSMWGVQAGHCAHFLSPDASSYPFSAYRDFKVERSRAGESETVDGHVCKIENATFTPKDGGASVIKMKLWEADDLRGFPIKIEVEAHGQPLRPLHYSDVSFDPPDPKLFQHPVKCSLGAKPGQTGTVKTAPAVPK
jgi:hypothetical protein